MTETQLLSGWGRTPASAAVTWCPRTLEEAAAALTASPPRGVIARGLGRSYGDAAQNAGGAVISTAGLNRIIEIDPDARTARVEAGVSLDQLMRATVPMGLWPYVTPGTRHVTVGGAIASDVHGKNHHHDGTFCAQVESFTLATPGAGVLTVSPTSDADVFWSTAGGMGLTGLVLEATLRLLPIETGYLQVETERLPDLDTLLERMSEKDNQHRYSVAWIDCLKQGRSLGRSILELGDHLPAGAAPAKPPARSFDPRSLITSPGWVPSGLLNWATVAAFNELWYRKSPRHPRSHQVPLATYFHPLDAVEGWNRIYGRRGFLQYQIVVPDGAAGVVRDAIVSLSSHRAPSFLAVLKRFGSANPGPLSFPRPGWTLAVDIPAPTGNRLGRVLDALDESVVAAGGRVYLSKDSRLRPDLLPVMYPELPRWRAVRDRLDPQRRLSSDLSRRLWSLLDDRPTAGRPTAGRSTAGRPAIGEALI